MNCPACYRFCSVEPFVSYAQVEYDGELATVWLDMALESQCCGIEVATATLSDVFPVTFEHGEADGEYVNEEGKCSGDIEVEVISEEPTDRYDNIGKRGKPVRNGKQYYGAEVVLQLTCPGCNGETEETFSLEVPSGEFELSY